MNNSKKRIAAATSSVAVLLSAIALGSLHVPAASAPQAQKEKPYVVEYYYKARWGHQEEFLRLFKKNHLPLLKKFQEAGRITEIEIEAPRYHATEDGRWDYRVAIEWRSFAAATDTTGEDALRKQLFPDQETFQKEEQRRFEILEAHWDVPIVEVSQQL